jgi:predicted ATPase
MPDSEEERNSVSEEVQSIEEGSNREEDEADWAEEEEGAEVPSAEGSNSEDPQDYAEEEGEDEQEYEGEAGEEEADAQAEGSEAFENDVEEQENEKASSRSAEGSNSEEPQDYAEDEQEYEGEAGEEEADAQAEGLEAFENDVEEQDNEKASSRSPYSEQRFGIYSKQEMLERNKLPFYGRGVELDRLQSAVDRITSDEMEDQCEAVWIRGENGVGKTSLIDEATDLLFETNSNIVCQGSCEEHHLAAKPLQAFADCLADLCDRLEQNGGKSLWQPRLEDALGGEGPLLVTVIPRLRRLVDVQPMDNRRLMMFDINSRRRFDRLIYGIRDFLQAVLEFHPIIMIVDNMHWADLDSLEMIERLMSCKSLQKFLLVGCHEPVDSSHPLEMHKAAIRETDIQETHIELKPFDLDSTKEILQGMLLDALLIDDEKAVQKTDDLAKTLFKFTKGNALWIMSTLLILNDKAVLKLDKGEFDWSKPEVKKIVKKWKDDEDKARKSAHGAIETRVEMCSKKVRFVVEAIASLRLTSFNLDKLDRVVKAAWTRTDKPCHIESEDDLQIAMSKACSNGFFENRGDNWFRFTHDSVRQSAYAYAAAKIKKPDKSMHLPMARELNLISVEDKNLRFKFLQVDQLNSCSSSIDDDERVKLYKLNQETAEICITKTCFRTAAEFLEMGMELLDNDTKWKKDLYDITLRNFLYLARMKVCCRQLEASKNVCKDLLKHTKSVKDNIYPSHLMFTVMMEEGKYEKALEKILVLLGKMGEGFPANNVGAVVETEIKNIQAMVHQRDNKQLLNPPKMNDRKSLDLNFLLALLVEISEKCERNYYKELATIRMMHLSLKFGFSRQYPLAFALMGVHLIKMGKIKEAHRFGQVAERLARGGDYYGGRAVMLFHWHISHWRRAYRRTLEPVLSIFNAQVDAGDFHNADFSIATYVQYHLASGFDLARLGDNLQLFEGLFFDYDMPDKWRIVIAQELVSNFMGETDSPLVFFGSGVSEEEEVVAEMERAGEFQGLEYFHFVQLFISCFFHDMGLAETCLGKLRRPPEGVWLTWHYFFECLVLISHLPSTRGKSRNDLKVRIEEKKGQLIDWYNGGAPNPNAMVSLLDAEYLVSKEAGKKVLATMKVQELYDEAIHAAAKDGSLHLEAFASERAGMYFDITGVDDLSARYLRRAHKKYDEWKAIAKVIDVEERFADILHIQHRRQYVVQDPNRTRRTGVKSLVKLAGKGTKKVKGLLLRKDKNEPEEYDEYQEEEYYHEDETHDPVPPQSSRSSEFGGVSNGRDEEHQEKPLSSKLFGKLKKPFGRKGKKHK